VFDMWAHLSLKKRDGLSEQNYEVEFFFLIRLDIGGVTKYPFIKSSVDVLPHWDICESPLLINNVHQIIVCDISLVFPSKILCLFLDSNFVPIFDKNHHF